MNFAFVNRRADTADVLTKSLDHSSVCDVISVLLSCQAICFDL